MTFSAQADDFGLVWLRPLFPYQRTGIRALLANAELLLADEMGLGKTIQAIGALRCLFASGESRAALVVAPAGLVLQWRREIKAWAPELRLLTVIGSAAARPFMWRAEAHIFVASYETVRADLAPCAPLRRKWDIVVIDEAQKIKNPESEISRAVKQLPRLRSWALTGTPLENRLDDLISILDFVAPGRFDPSAFARGLRRLLGEVQLRRRKADVLLDLPPKLSVEIPVYLEDRQRAAYERAEREGIMRLVALGVELRITHVLELILRLKQICNFCPETGASAKLADLRERVAQVVGNGERALVFSQFSSETFGVKRLANELTQFRPLVISGDLKPQERADVIARFERDHSAKLLLLSLRAGGVGLNLTAASYVFHFDRWWNPAVESQADDRVHRIGQVRPVHVYSYLSVATVEERVAAILAEKRQLFADVVDGVSLRHIRRLDFPTLLRAAAAR